MIEALFPPQVVVVRQRDDVPPELLLPAEESLAATMGDPRRREFTAGRSCARRALAELGVLGFPLLCGERRAPIWPESVVGSITHTKGLCAAAVARRDRFAGLGIDAEQLEPLSSGALARICSEAEREQLAALPGDDAAARWGKVVFSAKETLYKCYFPLTRFFIGFRDAEVELDPGSGRFLARLVREDAPDADGRRVFEGRFGTDDRHVVTALALPAQD